MYKNISYTALILSVVFLFSCNSLNSVVKAKQEGKGTTEVYNIGAEDAWKIAKKSFRWGGSDAIEEYEDEGYMLTSSGMNLVSSGAVMGAWVEPISDEQTKVTVITKRRIATQIATTLTEGKWHKFFAEGVRLTNAGQPLPLEKPNVE